jgi:transcriptional regulator with XRE-family HTH domain
MTFQDLHEALRKELFHRIAVGSLTQSGLARTSNFKQAHISNFLNGRRQLSLEGLDRVMAAEGLSVDQLVPLEISGSAAPVQAGLEQVDAVPLVSPSTAMQEAEVRASSILDTVPVSISRLPEHRNRTSPRSHWRRFVAVRADEQQGAAMDPVVPVGATVVLDRHYTSPAPYRAQQRTLYGVRSGGTLLLRYVEFDVGRLILRPLSLAFPVQLLPLGAQETAADYLVGRVCLVVHEV